MSVLDELTERRITRSDGRTGAWTEWGPPDGTPLLRLPGTPGCRLSVRSDTTPWAERGLRIITTERPGFGALPDCGVGASPNTPTIWLRSWTNSGWRRCTC